ncbi:kinase-like domain-containing protein [Catenaria anguillulae PL171]|uniref:1-phosphatidylinositol 4-kinase n=1 Tax=Catenaria anguillulae PL171 TaxID=765915 RepID=A0A1Y2HIZ9_9FUNG|nr:kinase-like domain-containing protein [Catenaria anguillulae PL171]
MKANMYRDEAGNEPDSLQPLFDEIIDKIIKSFSSADESFYQREFEFFNKITSISGKLKPYIKRSKPEKKKKIDEELAQIKVDVGCYLPSNPESTVIDIDYLSGRPLQSHAKAPFLATFKIERTTLVPPFRKEQVWQSAIFKVGDDCRQDVLALQLIALFKSVFASAHLDLYLFPYRVVATAPGCGVIEVIPNSTSRDMIGREKINSMFEYFVAKFGSPHTDAYRRAQRNFITSVAGYSVILYLLQIKDRHNGNIMLDSDGHLIHIDFGFILDISPGGVNFESSPFKLTTEMLQVIGQAGSDTFRDFVRCVVQAFLAIRPYADAIINLVQLMSESGLPCFKGEPTLRKLRARFVLEKSEREAARFMMDRIADSYENKRTVLYDQFQKQTNGIPY